MANCIEYGPISLWTLDTRQPLVCDLYIGERDQYVLYRAASLPFTAADRGRLLSLGITNLWVRISGDTRSLEQLNALLNLPDDKMPPPTKAGLLHASAMSVARRAIANPLGKSTLIEVHDLVSGTVSFLSHSQKAFPALLSLMVHDFSIYSHAVNVSVYALGLAKFIGITDHKELELLGLGAMLHDVGKSMVPIEILGKRGPLDDEEWIVVRKHPTWGLELLGSALELPKEVLAIVGQHHERLDGSGYPSGAAGDEVHWYATIVGLVDAYEAMTSDRLYRRANTPFGALSLLKKEVGPRLKPDLFASLVRLLGGLS